MQKKADKKKSFRQKFSQVKGLAIRTVSKRTTLYDKYQIICRKNVKPDVTESSKVTCVGSSVQLLGEGSTCI